MVDPTLAHDVVLAIVAISRANPLAVGCVTAGLSVLGDGAWSLAVGDAGGDDAAQAVAALGEAVTAALADAGA